MKTFHAQFFTAFHTAICLVFLSRPLHVYWCQCVNCCVCVVYSSSLKAKDDGIHSHCISNNLIYLTDTPAFWLPLLQSHLTWST